MSKGSEWFDSNLDIGDGWDTTPGIALNPRNYRRLMNREIHRALSIVDGVLTKHRARMRKELGEEIRQMKSQALEEARAEIRKALNADETVVQLEDLRRHGRRAA
jgi:hypothetical protein